MSRARQVRIQGYICEKLMSFYKNNPFAPSLTNLVNRELAAAINAKPTATRKPLEALIALAECVERRDSAEGMLKKLKFQREENGIWTNSEL